jgi:hypothetical protein
MAKIGRKATDYELIEGGAGGGRGVGSGSISGGGGMSAKSLVKQGLSQIKKADKEAIKVNRESGSLSDRVTGTRKAKDYKENAKDSTTKEISGELRFREPRQRTENEYITDYGRTPRMSDDMKKGGAIKKMATGGSVSKRADGIAKRGKTKGRVC